MEKMTNIEKDILTEILNICLAKAADSFAKISKEDVLIQVPDIKLVKEENALRDLINRQDIDLMIQSEIKGDIYGQTLLLFSNHQVDTLNKVLTAKVDPADKQLRESLLLEISNILTGTLVTHLANILKLNMYGSVPNAPIHKSQIKPSHLVLDMDMSRPILVTINTLFIKSKNSFDLPMMLIFDVGNLSKVLESIRKVNTDNQILVRK